MVPRGSSVPRDIDITIQDEVQREAVVMTLARISGFLPHPSSLVLPTDVNPRKEARLKAIEELASRLAGRTIEFERKT